MAYKPITAAELRRVNKATRLADATEPRAVAAAYDAATGKLIITMRGGAVLSVPVSTFKALSHATPKQLAEVVAGDGGAALFWDELDVQIGIIALLQIVFKIKTVQSVTQQAGRSRSAAKVAASRANGAKGGRPRKSPSKPVAA